MYNHGQTEIILLASNTKGKCGGNKSLITNLDFGLDQPFRKILGEMLLRGK